MLDPTPNGDSARASLAEVVGFNNHLHFGAALMGLVTHGLDVLVHVIPIAAERLANIDDHVNLHRAILASQLGFIALGFGSVAPVRKTNDHAQPDGRAFQQFRSSFRIVWFNAD